MSLNRKMAVGVLWNLASMVLTRGASLIFTLFLARLLAPESFGLVAMTAITFELANVLAESGLTQALIRKKSVTEVELSTAFIANLGLSLAAYVLLFSSAPLVAGYYQQPLLTPLVRVTGIVVILNALKLVQIAVLRRAMNFRAEMIANTAGALTSGAAAVLLASLGAGVWSLVAQILISGAVSVAVLWPKSGWRPSMQFSGESFAGLFKFGSRLAAEGFLETLFLNLYILVIGRLFSAELTGLYFFANRINSLISQQLSTAVQQATFPALSTLQDDDAALRVKYRQILQTVFMVIAPVMLLLAALAEPLFTLVFGAKWAGAVVYLQVLSVAGVLYPLHALNVNMLLVKGRSDLLLGIGILKKAMGLILLFLAIPYGVEGIVVSQVIGSVLALVPNTYYSRKLIGYGLGAQFMDVFKPTGAAALAALSAWALAPVLAESLLGLCLCAALGGALFLVLAAAVRAEGWKLFLVSARSMANLTPRRSD